MQTHQTINHIGTQLTQNMQRDAGLVERFLTDPTRTLRRAGLEIPPDLEPHVKKLYASISLEIRGINPTTTSTPGKKITPNNIRCTACKVAFGTAAIQASQALRAAIPEAAGGGLSEAVRQRAHKSGDPVDAWIGDHFRNAIQTLEGCGIERMAAVKILRDLDAPTPNLVLAHVCKAMRAC